MSLMLWLEPERELQFPACDAARKQPPKDERNPGKEAAAMDGKRSGFLAERPAEKEQFAEKRRSGREARPSEPRRANKRKGESEGGERAMRSEAAAAPARLERPNMRTESSPRTLVEQGRKRKTTPSIEVAVAPQGDDDDEEEEEMDVPDEDFFGGRRPSNFHTAFLGLTGEFVQYPDDDEEAHPGIGKRADRRRNTISFLVAEHRQTFHKATGSLVFLCYLIPHLWEALDRFGVPQSSFFDIPLQTEAGPVLETKCLYSSTVTKKAVSTLDKSAILMHVCNLLIGVVIGSSDKIKSGAHQIKRRIKAMLASLKKESHAEAANILQFYPPVDAINWLNTQPWIGSFVADLIMSKFKSPVKEMMEQVKLVAKGARMTTYTTIRQYLDQCMDATIMLAPVAKEIIPFLKLEKTLKNENGDWFDYLGAIRHPDAMKLAPRNFPNLASAALFWSKRTTSTMSGYKAPVIKQGATVTKALLVRAAKREVTRVGVGGDLPRPTMDAMV